MSTVGAVAGAIAALAGLLLYLYQTRWSEKAKWLRELRRLEDEFREADEEHEAALAGSDNDVLARAGDRWLSVSEALERHRDLGRRAGFSR